MVSDEVGHWKERRKVCNLNVTFICYIHYVTFRLKGVLWVARQSNGHSFIKFNPLTLQWCFFNYHQAATLHALWGFRGWTVALRRGPLIATDRPFVLRLNDEGGWWWRFMFYVVSCVFEFGETSIGTNFGYRTCSNCFNGVVTESLLHSLYTVWWTTKATEWLTGVVTMESKRGRGVESEGIATVARVVTAKLCSSKNFVAQLDQLWVATLLSNGPNHRNVEQINPWLGYSL